VEQAATRTLTILFTDLVDSTTLLARFGDEGTEELRREHFALLRAEIVRHHGEEVKSLGDGIMVAFESASDALASAVAMQQSLHARNEAADAPLMIRVGLSSGDVDAVEQDYFGRPVVEAARLCAVAAGGQILVGELTRLLIGTRGAYNFVSAGALELKGLEEPVVSYVVEWEPLPRDAMRVPLPARVIAVADSLFFGRDAELATLEAARKWVSVERRRRVVMIGGEPGIGKTTLAAQAARRAYDEGSIVLYGRADEDLGVPYQAWMEIIGYLLEHGGSELLDHLDDSQRAALTTILPTVAGARTRSSSDPESERYLLFGAVLQLLAAASDVEPVVVVLDDLQWADAPSLQLLRYVAASVEPMRVVVFGTYRESEITADHALAGVLAFLHREQVSDRISLRGLRDVDLLALMEAASGQAADAAMVALRDALLAETDGNPFFVGELLRHLAETGAIQEQDGRWVTTADLHETGLPVSVREVVARRAARLGEEATRVLALAAVIGRDFDLDSLVTAAGDGADAVIDVLDAAVAATLIRNLDATHYTFVHALVSHALYESLTPARRSRAHIRVAEAIEQLAGGEANAGATERVGELAHHWSRAQAGDGNRRAIHYAQLAGDRALVCLAPDEGRRWYGEALELLDPAAARGRVGCELLVGLGDAERQSGDPAHRATLLRAARLAQELGAADLLVRAALANSRGYFSAAGTVDTDRVEVLDAAVAATEGAQDAQRARLLGQLASELVFAGDPVRWSQIADEALQAARAAGDPVTLLAVLNAIQQPTTPDSVARRTVECAEATELAHAVGDLFLDYLTAVNTAVAAFQRGDREAADAATAWHASVADRLGQPTVRWGSEFMLAGSAIVDGDLEEAETLTERALACGQETGQPDALAMYAVQTFAIRTHQDRAHEFLPLLEQIVAENSGIPGWRSSLAYTYCLSGRPDDARDVLMTDIESGFAYPRDSTWLFGLMAAARTLDELGESRGAAELLELLSPYVDQLEYLGPASAGPVAIAVAVLEALLGRRDEADDHFALAVSLAERMRAVEFAADARITWAGMLAQSSSASDVDRARALLEDALPVVAERGYRLLARRADVVTQRLAERD
jgi:class 3 adenylate cyclase